MTPKSMQITYVLTFPDFIDAGDPHETLRPDDIRIIRSLRRMDSILIHIPGGPRGAAIRDAISGGQFKNWILILPKWRKEVTEIRHWDFGDGNPEMWKWIRIIEAAIRKSGKLIRKARGFPIREDPVSEGLAILYEKVLPVTRGEEEVTLRRLRSEIMEYNGEDWERRSVERSAQYPDTRKLWWENLLRIPQEIRRINNAAIGAWEPKPHRGVPPWGSKQSVRREVCFDGLDPEGRIEGFGPKAQEPDQSDGESGFREVPSDDWIDDIINGIDQREEETKAEARQKKAKPKPRTRNRPADQRLDERIRDLVLQGKKDPEIAREVGISSEAVRKRRRVNLNLSGIRGRRVTSRLS